MDCLRVIGRVWLLSLAAGSVLGTGAQNPDLRYMNSQAWSTEDGLPQNSVHAIAQTADGFIWAGTEAGLVRFDGVRFAEFRKQAASEFRSDDICCLIAGGQGGLWIGTSDGLVHLWRGEFKRFTDGLPSATIEKLEPLADGSLQVTTSGGRVRWATADDPVVATGPAATAQPKTPGRVVSVTTDRSGLEWVAMSSGLVVIDPVKGTETRVEEFNGVSTLCVFQDREGSYWVGTESSGLHLLRRQRFRGIVGLAGKAITSVAQSSDGTTWVGTREDGVYRVIEGKVDQPIAARALTSAVVLALQPSADGGVWVGTPDGLNRVDKAGRVWQITSANGLPDDYVRSLMAAPDGGVWAGTRHGLVHLHGGRADTLTTMDGLGGDMIGVMLLEKGKGLWAATSGGLSFVGVDGKVRNYSTGDGLSTPIVTAMAFDGVGKLRVVTDDGTLSTFDGPRFQRVFGLLCDKTRDTSVEAITFDASPSFWVRTDRHIERIGLAALASAGPCELPDEAAVRYGPADGLRNDEVVPRAAAIPWLAANGELWFPTRSGVAIADTTLPQSTVGPPVVVEQMLLEYAGIDLRHGDPQLPFSRERLTMEYAGLSYLAPAEMHYRYRLEGFDTQWTDAANRRSATYTNLPPGWYTFRVQARNNDGPWNIAGAQLRFRIVPPLYRRWWFLLLAALLLAALVVGAYLLRLRRLRSRFDAVLAERNRMAREIHDTLTQDFVSTSLQLDIVAQQLKRGQVEKAIAQVKQARQLVTEGLEEARRSIWELRANTSQDTLPTRLTRLAEREAFSQLRPEVKVRGAYRALDPRVEREILRVANEALMNAMKHAAPEHTSVDLYYSSEALLLTVKDDGAGFDVGQALGKTGHYGLIGMRERAAIIDGELEVLSEQGKGTTILLRVALENKNR